MLSILAPAKLNLTLEVLKRRPDGYHEIRSVIQAIDLSDSLFIEEGEGIEVIYDPPLNLENDLVLKAAKILKERTGCPKGAIIKIRKVIPLASGLGGGSSDAAATLKGLNKLWGLSLGQKELIQLASEIGSDAPFFILGGTALVVGRGEEVTPLPPLPTYKVILLFPPLAIPRNKTAYLYHSLTPASFTEGGYSQLLAQQIKEGKGLNHHLFFNAFESIAFHIFPELQRYKAILLQSGAEMVHLAGSGPTLFSLEGEGVYNCLLEQGLKVYLSHTLGADV